MTEFSDPRLHKLDGFRVEIDAARERADVILDRPPLNVIEMAQRDQLRLVFEALDEDARRTRDRAARRRASIFPPAAISRAFSRRRPSMSRNWPGTSRRRRAAQSR